MRPFISSLLVVAAVSTVACGRSSDSPTAPRNTSSSSLVTIVEVTGGFEVTAGGTGTFNYPGQSVTIPDGPGFDNVKFNWYTFEKSPTAFGRLCALTQEYLGLPRDLGSNTPGFLACSEHVAGNQYVFTASMTMKPGRYWFYGDTQGSFATSFDTDIYAGGDLYVTGFPTNPFRRAPASGRMNGGVYVPPPPGVYLDANFKLEGRVVSGG